MKNVAIKIFAVMLTVWYSMSIIGFDVHTCSGSGRSFVVTFIEGLTCEDIHPEHTCNEASCCSGNHESCCSDVAGHEPDHSACQFCNGTSVSAKSCCSSDYQVLTLTGAVASNDHDHFDECGCGHCPCIDFTLAETSAFATEKHFIRHIQEPDSGFARACERQASLRVWRI